MATSTSQIEYIAEQLSNLGSIRYKKMFGEYGLYCNELFFALVCDDRLFVKIKPTGKNSLNRVLSHHIIDKLDFTITAFPGIKNFGHVHDETLESVEDLMLICKEVLKLLA
jgi:hypothetical protein